MFGLFRYVVLGAGLLLGAACRKQQMFREAARNAAASRGQATAQRSEDVHAFGLGNRTRPLTLEDSLYLENKAFIALTMVEQEAQDVCLTASGSILPRSAKALCRFLA